MSADAVIPFLFEHLPVRGALVTLERSWRRMQRDHDYAVPVRDTLGHAAAATALIAHSLKFDGTVTLQIQGDGPLAMLVVQASSSLELRGMATARGVADDFATLVGRAHCAITVDNNERPYQGIVEVVPESLAASLEHYFDRSVQVPSHLVLVSNADRASGVLLQQMPDQSAADADDWHRLGLLLGTLGDDDFARPDDVGLLRLLFAEDDVRVFEPRPVVFRCRCSARRTEDVLRMLGESETQAALEEQGEIEVVCEYCGRQRRYDAVDIARVFAGNVVPGPDATQ